MFCSCYFFSFMTVFVPVSLIVNSSFLQKNLSKPMNLDEIDSSNGVMFIFYDPDTNMVYLAGKASLFHSDAARTRSTERRYYNCIRKGSCPCAGLFCHWPESSMAFIFHAIASVCNHQRSHSLEFMDSKFLAHTVWMYVVIYRWQMYSLLRDLARKCKIVVHCK